MSSKVLYSTFSKEERLKKQREERVVIFKENSQERHVIDYNNHLFNQHVSIEIGNNLYIWYFFSSESESFLAL